jgi:hypothetical protein
MVILGYAMVAFGGALALAKTVGYVVTQDPAWLH